MRKKGISNDFNTRRKDNHSGTKQRIAFIAAATIIGIFLVGSTLTSTLSLSSFLTATMLQSANAASDPSITVGTGEGTIVYRAHRMQDARWAPCFATNCDAGTGPGVSMFFIVYNSSLASVGSGQADETGTVIKGLVVGQTYYISPENCGPPCHGESHSVTFDHWADNGSKERQRKFVTTSSAAINADACYAFVKDGIRSSGICSAGNTSPPPNPPPTTTASRWDNAGARAELELMIERATDVKLTKIQTEDNGAVTLTGELTAIATAEGQPKYESLNELVNKESPSTIAAAMLALDFAGIDFNSLSEKDKTSLLLTLLYGSAGGSTTIAEEIPDTNLSGVPLGSTGTVIEYGSFYDVANSHSREVALVMQELELRGIDFNSLSDEQKSYVVLTHTYGQPQ